MGEGDGDQIDNLLTNILQPLATTSAGLVESVVLLGAPVSIKGEEWTLVRKVNLTFSLTGFHQHKQKSIGWSSATKHHISLTCLLKYHICFHLS